MGLKRRVREQLEKIVAVYGYELKKVEPNAFENPFGFLSDIRKYPFSEEDFAKRSKDRITLSWVIPPLGPGSGGHTTIFRAITNLTRNGIHNVIYVFGGNTGIPSDDLKRTVTEFYGFVLDDEEIYSNVFHMKYSDAIIATSWNTAYVVKDFDNCISKYYFVQDFEPWFFAVGSHFRMAENTYHFGFRGVTAGKWLEQKLHDEYGMETYGFCFSYDRSIYYKRVRKDDRKRIFFYARPYTERRGFELGVMALKMLHEKRDDIEIVMAGQNLMGTELGFPYTDLGIVKPAELSELYANADICLVMSMTNLSLLPLEVMASGSVCVTNRGANNEWMVNEQNAVLVDNDPSDIAEKLLLYLNRPDELERLRKAGAAFAEQFTWEEEFAKVAEYIDRTCRNDIENYMDTGRLQHGLQKPGAENEA